ncbi:hypothetical protein BamMEX5DRAFT_6787 [Burkholderia ambifaria MEX-5]|uniref:Uncharacterized protein n=1 Tax=Burkholderia ambifaria MEX-5 TaxID=396597 RepID=B1TG71_9BURK|nr:hypothetical protein BamMEX5DRAFT_6787 [Burkholderia ambifaria MEX-5]
MPAVRNTSRATALSSAAVGVPGSEQTRTGVAAVDGTGSSTVPAASALATARRESGRFMIVARLETGETPAPSARAQYGWPGGNQPRSRANTYSVPPRGTSSAALAIGPPQIGFAPP